MDGDLQFTSDFSRKIDCFRIQQERNASLRDFGITTEYRDDFSDTKSMWLEGFPVHWYPSSLLNLYRTVSGDFF